MQLDPQILIVLALNILAIGVTYGDARARINMLERRQAELKDELKEAIKVFTEKQERVLERLISIESMLKTGESHNDPNE